MKLRHGWLALLAMTLLGASVQADETYPTVGGIERLDPALDALVPADAKLEKVAEGFNWSEGPVWVKDGGYVIFSDVPENTIFKWKAGEGLSAYLKPSGYTGDSGRGGETGSNGLVIDAEGRLLLCQHGDRRIARMDAPTDKPAAKFVTVAGKHDGKRFNSPNDLAIYKNGDIYFTDPPYGLEKYIDDPLRETDVYGVYRVNGQGEVTLLVDDLARPNGIAFSPDFKTMYVAQSDPQRAVYMAYPVQEDGTVGEGRVLFDATELAKSRKGLPDGLKVDTKGNLFATGPGGVLVISPEGKHLGTLLTGQATGNCCFGDDGRTLYITADMFLLRIRLNAEGANTAGPAL